MIAYCYHFKLLDARLCRWQSDPMTEIQSPTYLTPKQVAELAQRHHLTVHSALRDGDLHGVQRKKHATWRIRQDCAEAWIEGEDCVHVAREKASRKKRAA